MCASYMYTCRMCAVHAVLHLGGEIHSVSQREDSNTGKEAAGKEKVSLMGYISGVYNPLSSEVDCGGKT